MKKYNDHYDVLIENFREDSQTNGALTKVIPMAEFEANEHLVRKLVKEIGGRIYFRGPRVGTAGTTLRKNAKGIVIYA